MLPLVVFLFPCRAEVLAVFEIVGVLAVLAVLVVLVANHSATRQLRRPK